MLAKMLLIRRGAVSVEPIWKSLRAHVPLPVRQAFHQLVLELQIARLHSKGVRKASRLSARDGLFLLNLGCGNVSKPGWINVDLFDPTADLALDLRQPLPFPDESASYIYIEHFFEHLDYPDVSDSMGWQLERTNTPSEARQLLRECRRVLSPGGTIDIVVPDTEGMIDIYTTCRNIREQGTWWGPRWCDTAMHRVNYLFRQGRQHKYAYDEETLRQALRESAFQDVRRRSFDPEMDAPNHAIGSLCMIGSK